MDSSSAFLFELIDLEKSEHMFVADVPHLIRLSHRIEENIHNHAPPVEIFVGFQKLSFFPPQQERYVQLATFSDIWLFAYPDMDYVIPNTLHLISLEKDDELTRYWFIVVQCATYQKALVAYETEIDSQNQFRFRGVTTSDPDTVQVLTDYLKQTIQDHRAED